MDLFSNIFKVKTTPINKDAAIVQVHSPNVLADKVDAAVDRNNSLDEDEFLGDSDTINVSRSAEEELETTAASIGERGDESLEWQ